MQIKYTICLFVALISASVVAEDRIEIVIPTVEDETEYVWRTLQDVPFFEQHGYDISLPEHHLVDELVIKARDEKLESADRDRLDRLMRDEVYDRSSYLSAHERIRSRSALIDQLINRLDDIEKQWDYRSFETYTVRLTHYGPGGSYDPDTGTILIFATPEGSFKQYKDPACTIIHEVVHIGIEQSIVSRLNLPHALKERVVDRVVWLNFHEELPEYRIQNMGYTALDEYMTYTPEVSNLGEILERFMNEYTD